MLQQQPKILFLYVCLSIWRCLRNDGIASTLVFIKTFQGLPQSLPDQLLCMDLSVEGYGIMGHGIWDIPRASTIIVF